MANTVNTQVDQVMTEFDIQYNASKPKRMDDIRGLIRKVVTEAYSREGARVAGAAVAAKPRAKKASVGEASDEPTAWNNLVNHKKYGLHIFDPKLSAELKPVASNNHFKLIKLMRDKMEGTEQWTEYIKWVHEQHSKGAELGTPSPRKNGSPAPVSVVDVPKSDNKTATIDTLEPETELVEDTETEIVKDTPVTKTETVKSIEVKATEVLTTDRKAPVPRVVKKDVEEVEEATDL